MFLHNFCVSLAVNSGDCNFRSEINNKYCKVLRSIEETTNPCENGAEKIKSWLVKPTLNSLKRQLNERTVKRLREECPP